MYISINGKNRADCFKTAEAAIKHGIPFTICTRMWKKILPSALRLRYSNWVCAHEQQAYSFLRSTLLAVSCSVLGPEAHAPTFTLLLTYYGFFRHVALVSFFQSPMRGIGFLSYITVILLRYEIALLSEPWFRTHLPYLPSC